MMQTSNEINLSDLEWTKVFQHPNYGVFERVLRKARKAVNPMTKEIITVKAKHAVKFKVSSSLKKAIL